ncbi:hypothetical protein A2U01_0059395, partial [Trifolium medium]|nr:hypothetical protein [Trifolium medium]
CAGTLRRSVEDVGKASRNCASRREEWRGTPDIKD